ncbi:hypothetical protein AAG570_001658 [Ranatra chinensis]|uniref:GRIP domain-containing protein n=1 Tax=Ranatra chinensis TaxID=642074 RepID=A0ABD0Y956_9HEMI
MECSGLHSEIQGLNAALVAERTELQKLIVDKVEYNNRYEQLQHLLKEKTGQLEQIECSRDKEVGTLNQEVESLRNQLEYASQLLRVVDRQEAEGQPAVDNTAQVRNSKLCPNGCAETQEELNKITTILLNEQTTNKILRNQIDELAEKLSKSEGKLVTLKQHLVEVEENYSGELMVAREKVADLQARLVHADERVRSSSTAYTSASIRANQQVESLTLQVKSLNEQKEKLEAELSKAEDSVQRQVAAVTNLQAVLHQFQRDKQKDIDFETERIRQVLNESNSKNQELASEIRQLGEQLNEAKKGLAAATRLSEQLDKKSEIIASLKKQVSELTETLKLEEDKVKAAYTNVEGKVDRCLVKNLIVGYLSAPAKNREQVIRVIATVLDLNKEERQKVGLEPATTQQQQSLSEAFIRFLETESQPKPQLLLPLAQPQAERPRSRKTSQASSTGSLLLADELPSLPHFTSVGRSPGSILKDVLKDRNT